MRAKRINEGMFDDEASMKTLAGWAQTFSGNPNFSKTVVVNKPFEITFRNEADFGKFTYILQKHRVAFEEFETVAENLKFSDGMEFDTSGELRAEEREDGWYVVGKGMLIPVIDEEEANYFIEKYKYK